jgi:hypothetical protein
MKDERTDLAHMLGRIFEDWFRHVRVYRLQD